MNTKVKFANSDSKFRNIHIRKDNEEFSPDPIKKPKDIFELVWSDSKLMELIEKSGSEKVHKSLQNKEKLKSKKIELV